MNWAKSMQRAAVHLFCCMLLLLAPCLAAAGQHALLIGVSDYSDPRIPDLEGPVNDVQALRSILINNWQFSDSNITVLLDAQATENAILKALDTLEQTTTSGDDVIVYYSGHGTSAVDPDLGARLNLPDGSGAIVGNDFNPSNLSERRFSAAANDGLLIGRFEIKPRLQKLDKDRNVLVIFDACFSGNAVRSISSPFTPRQRRQIELSDYLPDSGKNTLNATEQIIATEQTTRSFSNNTDPLFSYQNIVYFGASAEDQYAVDLSQAEIEAGLVSTIDGKPHGAFTDSLLRALSDTSASHGTVSFIELFNRAVNHFNTWCASCGHTPVSLPAAGTVGNSLLGRTILTPSLLLSEDTQYNAESEPALQEALIVDTLHNDGSVLSLRSLQQNVLNDSGISNDTTRPDIYFTHTENQINAYAGDGQLISQMPLNLSGQAMTQWLAGRKWFKRRMLRDMKNNHAQLHVNFRHPLADMRVRGGDYLHFNVLSETEAKLVVLLLNANSELSIIYPVNASERRRILPALQAQRIPRYDEPQIQVRPPWGTDTVMFYALPENHALSPLVQQLAKLSSIGLSHPALQAFENALDDDSFSYSSAIRRIVAEPRL